MGGRGDTSKSFNANKVVSNIDAPRNKPFRDKRAKELEADRTAKQAAQLKSAVVKPARTKSKIIEKKGTVAIMARVADGSSEIALQNAESFARTKDGTLHANKSGKYNYNITDKTGYAITSFTTRKGAIQFLNAATNKNGRVSPTIKRQAEYMKTLIAHERGTPFTNPDHRADKALKRIAARIREKE